MEATYRITASPSYVAPKKPYVLTINGTFYGRYASKASAKTTAKRAGVKV